MGEGQGVTPEEPLESHNGDGHQRQPNQSQSRLAAGKTTVEKTNTGDHEQYKTSAGHDPGEITGRIGGIDVFQEGVDALVGHLRWAGVLGNFVGRHGERLVEESK